MGLDQSRQSFGGRQGGGGRHAGGERRVGVNQAVQMHIGCLGLRGQEREAMQGNRNALGSGRHRQKIISSADTLRLMEPVPKAPSPKL